MQVGTPCSLDIIGAARSPEEFNCSLTDLDGETTDILDTTLSKNEDTPNQFVLLLQPKDELGTATVEVKLGGTDIKNSPFTVKICDASKCCVSGLEDIFNTMHDAKELAPQKLNARKKYSYLTLKSA